MTKNSNLDDYSLINSTTPMQIYVNQLRDSLYHGKNYYKDLDKGMKKFKSLDQVSVQQNVF